jgi:type IV pilus assembly protein PilV
MSLQFNKISSTIMHQQGVFLLEALLALLIFAFGILGIVALGATAINAQTDAEYRTEAANYANEMISTILTNANRVPMTGIGATGYVVDASSIETFRHNASGTTPCEFSGSASTSPLVTSWVNRMTTISASNAGLPGATGSGTAKYQQILVDTTDFNRVTVTVCWKSPKDGVPRRHTVVSNVN